MSSGTSRSVTLFEYRLQYTKTPTSDLAWRAVHENRRMAYAIARTHGRGSADDNQDAMIALYHAFIAWDVTRSREIRKLATWKFNQIRTDVPGPLVVGRSLREGAARWEREVNRLRAHGQPVPRLPPPEFGLTGDLVSFTFLRHAVAEHRGADDEGRFGFERERWLQTVCVVEPEEREDLLDRHLQAAWTEIDPGDQAVLFDRFVNEFTLDQIGAELKLSREGSRLRVRVAVKKLREEVENQARMTRQDREVQQWRTQT